MTERPSEKTRVVLISIIVAFAAVGLALALLANGNDALRAEGFFFEIKFGLWRKCKKAFAVLTRLMMVGYFETNFFICLMDSFLLRNNKTDLSYRSFFVLL